MPSEMHINYNDNKGFWIHEMDMQIVCYFIERTFSRLDAGCSFRKELAEELAGMNAGGLRGLMGLYWESYLRTPQDVSAMIHILEETIAELKGNGPLISTEELMLARCNHSDGNPWWNQPMKIGDVTRVLLAMIAVLEGKWDSTDDLDFDYWQDYSISHSVWYIVDRLRELEQQNQSKAAELETLLVTLLKSPQRTLRELPGFRKEQLEWMSPVLGEWLCLVLDDRMVEECRKLAKRFPSLEHWEEDLAAAESEMQKTRETLPHLKPQVRVILDRIERKHLNDPTTNDDLDAITTMLSANVERAIKTLQELDEEETDHIAALLPEIAWNVKSRVFLDAIIELPKRFPKLRLHGWIKEAEESLDTE